MSRPSAAPSISSVGEAAHVRVPATRPARTGPRASSRAAPPSAGRSPRSASRLARARRHVLGHEQQPRRARGGRRSRRRTGRARGAPRSRRRRRPRPRSRRRRPGAAIAAERAREDELVGEPALDRRRGLGEGRERVARPGAAVEQLGRAGARRPRRGPAYAQTGSIAVGAGPLDLGRRVGRGALGLAAPGSARDHRQPRRSASPQSTIPLTTGAGAASRCTSSSVPSISSSSPAAIGKRGARSRCDARRARARRT